MPGFRALGGQALLLIVLSGPAAAGEPARLAQIGCHAIAGMVDAAAPSGAVFIASYPTADSPALRGTAFVYDNALAAVALLACGDQARAGRIGAALRIAATHDRFWHDGRIRNAYRAGAVAEGAAPALPGWWDGPAGRWDEDPYAVGTATGNVAWAALALVSLADAGGPQQDRTAAAALMDWVKRSVATPLGFAGGFFGEEPNPTRLGWLSTEHNVDAAAAFRLLGDASAAARARSFVASMWDGTTGRFWLGTPPDGSGINRASSGIDAELWPLIAFDDAPAEWQRVSNWVRAHHAVAGGYGFRDDPDGIWTEGTAQAALVLGETSLFGVLLATTAPDGLLYACPDARVRTGLALRPDSTTDDFFYFHLPHLGATAWAVLAATGTNPFRPVRGVAAK